MGLYTKVTPNPAGYGEPIKVEVRTTPEDVLVCVVEQADDGIVVYTDATVEALP